MKIDLRGAKISCKSDLATLVSVSNSGNGALLMIYADKDGNELEWFGNGSLEAQRVLGFDAVHFHSAINAEGYEASRLIERIHLAGMDEHGVIKSADMRPEYSDIVHDWQWSRPQGSWHDLPGSERPWSEEGIAWRPKSYAIKDEKIQPIGGVGGMKINIARAGIRGYGVIIDHVSIDGGLFLHAEQIPYGPFRSVYDADVDSDRLLAAIRAEGFRLWAEDGAHEFRPIIFSSQDEAGQMKAEDMRPEYLDQVRDWQIGMLGGDWIDSQNLDVGATGTLWRPKSRSIEIDEGLLNPWAGAETDGQFQTTETGRTKASEPNLSNTPRTVIEHADPEETARRVRESFNAELSASESSALSVGYRVEGIGPEQAKQSYTIASDEMGAGEPDPTPEAPEILGSIVRDSETFAVLSRDAHGIPTEISMGYQVERTSSGGSTETISIPPWRSMSEHIALPKNKPTDVWPTPVDRTGSGGTLDQTEPLPTDHKTSKFPPDAGMDWPGLKINDPAPSAFERIALSMAALVEDKQRQYGDSVGKTGALLAILYPDGIQPDQYDRVLLVVRMLDKMSRFATNKTDLGGESPFRDIMGYAMLAIEKGI